MIEKLARLFLTTLLSAIGAVQISAITVDTSANTADFTFGGVRNTPLTVPLTIQQSAEILYVGVSNNRTLTATPTVFGCVAGLSPTGSVTAISYNGNTNFQRYTTPVTNLGAVLSPNGCASVEIFRLVNPPVGAGTLSVTIPAGGDYAVVGATALIGVNSSVTTTGALMSATGTSDTAALTLATTANDFVLDTLGAEFNSRDLIPNNLQTRLWRMNDDPPIPPPFYVGAGSGRDAGANTSITMRWTLASAGGWVLGGIVIPETASAAQTTIGGRVVDKRGRGVSRAFVSLTDADGNLKTIVANSFGYFRFDDIQVGQTVVLQASAKRLSFEPLSVNVGEAVTNLVLSPLE